MATTVLLGITASFVAFCFLKGRPAVGRGWRIALYVLAIIFVGAYIGCHVRFVRTLQIPSQNTEVVVSVGYERSAAAQRAGDVSDGGLF